jgi:hypothetical protein
VSEEQVTVARCRKCGRVLGEVDGEAVVLALADGAPLRLLAGSRWACMAEGCRWVSTWQGPDPRRRRPHHPLIESQDTPGQ